VALREFQLNDGYGEADYLLYVDGKAAGVIEAKRVGATLTGVEPQSVRYSKGLPDSLPKTLVLAKDDNHAEAIVQILREEFGRGNEFAQKITYRTTGDIPENLINAFRTSYYPRIAVTVDMITTGTDIKPVEIVVFMRSVKSRSFFEQMKGHALLWATAIADRRSLPRHH